MLLTFACPRCEHSVTVSQRTASGYVQCPHCNVRLWVSAQTGSEQPAGGVAVETSGTQIASNGSGASIPVATLASAASQPAAPSNGSIRQAAAIAPANRPSASSAAGSSSPEGAQTQQLPEPAAAKARGVSTATVPAEQPAVGQLPGSIAGGLLPPLFAVQGRKKKVARLISADMAQSPIVPAADGKLPELQLRDGRTETSESSRSRTVSPLVLALVLLVSITCSVLLVFVDVGNPGGKFDDQKAEALAYIAKFYFPDVHEAALDKATQLRPYQLYLQEAQRAHARSDRRAERSCYQKVLDLLHAEGGSDPRGLTGSARRDKDLEERITLLLRED